MNNFVVKANHNRKRKEMEKLVELQLVRLDAVAALQFTELEFAYYESIKTDYDALLSVYCKRC